MTEALAGARCATHPDRSGVGTCTRCGDFACAECNITGSDTEVVCRNCAEHTVQDRYHVVPVWRFAVLSLFTYGIYELYWFWKNWTLIKQRDRSAIWPIPRAIFAGVTYFQLVTDLNSQLELRNRKQRLSMGLAMGFLVASAMYRLPGALSLISVLGFLFLIPAVRTIHDLAGEAARRDTAGWRLRHTLLMLAAVPFFFLASLGLILGDESG